MGLHCAWNKQSRYSKPCSRYLAPVNQMIRCYVYVYMYMHRTDIDRDTWPLWAHLRRRRGGPPHRLAGAYVAQRVHKYPYSSWIPVCLFARAVRAKRNSGHDRSNRITSRSICLCIHIDVNPYRPWWDPFWASRGSHI
jgi:hypothetical protein